MCCTGQLAEWVLAARHDCAMLHWLAQEAGHHPGYPPHGPHLVTLPPIPPSVSCCTAISQLIMCTSVFYAASCHMARSFLSEKVLRVPRCTRSELGLSYHHLDRVAMALGIIKSRHVLAWVLCKAGQEAILACPQLCCLYRQ